jgi:hypothetical protein
VEYCAKSELHPRGGLKMLKGRKICDRAFIGKRKASVNNANRVPLSGHVICHI